MVLTLSLRYVYLLTILIQCTLATEEIIQDPDENDDSFFFFGPGPFTVLDENDDCQNVNPNNSVNSESSYEFLASIPGHCTCHSDVGPSSLNGNFEGRDVCYLRCFPCDKVYPRCQIQGNCCNIETKQLDFDLAEKTSTYDKYECKKTHYAHTGPLSQSYLVQRSCPDTFLNTTVRRLCEENGLSSSEETVKTENIVSDESSGVTYFNEYCAQCNYVINVVPWAMEISCKTFNPVKDARNENDLMTRAKMQSRMCRITQLPPLQLDPTTCNPKFRSKTQLVVGFCSYAGFITEVDPQIEEACEEGPDNPLNYVAIDREVFKNFYCAVCNTKYIDVLCPMDSYTPREFVPTISYMVGSSTALQSQTTIVMKNLCPSNQWPSPTGQCEPLMCAGGKNMITHINGSVACVTSFDVIRGLFYKGRFVLKFLDQGTDIQYHDTTAATVADKIIETIVAKLSSVIRNIAIEVGLLYKVQGLPDMETSRHLKFEYAQITFAFDGKSELPRDTVEKGILEMYTATDFEIEPCEGCRIHFQSQIVYDSRPYNVYPFSRVNFCRDHDGVDCYSITKEYNISTNQDSFVLKSTEEVGQTLTMEEAITLTPTLVCPHIRIPINSFNLTLADIPVTFINKLSLKFEDQIFTTLDPAHMNQIAYYKDWLTEEFYICSEALESIVNHIDADISPSSNGYNLKSILTIVCMTTSLICLFFTVLPYFLLPSVRSVAGCNTVGLCISLIISQALIVATSHIEGPSVVCTGIGITTYYSWLVMFSWSLVCCFHMFRIFTTDLKFKGRAAVVAVGKNTTFTILAPAFIVIVVIIINYVLYDGEKIGFGQRACVVDNMISIQIPMITVIICNFIFFLIVVRKIYRIRQQQNSKDGQGQMGHDFIIYIILSTVTGIFWILDFVGEMIENDVMRYLAIVFNGFQGVFLFVSFTCNRRVMKHFNDTYGCFSRFHSKTSSIDTKTTSQKEQTTETQ